MGEAAGGEERELKMGSRTLSSTRLMGQVNWVLG